MFRLALVLGAAAAGLLVVEPRQYCLSVHFL
jgi:hypothetical protein